MTSLAEAYEGHVGEVRSLRRLYLGVGLCVAGTVLVVAAIVVASTDLLAMWGYPWWEARELAGVYAGLGVPAVFVGIFTVLPTTRRIRAAGTIGASVAVLGVTLFLYAYPYNWVSSNTLLPLLTTTVYFAGTVTALWSMFAAVATFKRRNDPGGTVTLEITREGATRIVEVSRDELANGLGSLGLIGNAPDGEVRTQTAASTDGGASGAVRGTASGTTSTASASTGTSGSGDGWQSVGDGEWEAADEDMGPADPAKDDAAIIDQEPTRERGEWPAPDANRTGSQTATSAGAGSTDGSQAATVSDGGASEREISSPMDDDAQILSSENVSKPADSYCGNCRHFEYVRSNQGMEPYCGFHRETMDDMDACEEWSPRS